MGFFVIISLKRGDSMQTITADILKKLFTNVRKTALRGRLAKC